MKFAFIIMGEFDAARDMAEIHGGKACLMGVSTIEDACTAAKQLLDKGVGCVELCGAFGPSGAKKVIETAGKSTPVGLPPICRNRKSSMPEPLAKRNELLPNPADPSVPGRPGYFNTSSGSGEAVFLRLSFRQPPGVRPFFFLKTLLKNLMSL